MGAVVAAAGMGTASYLERVGTVGGSTAVTASPSTVTASLAADLHLPHPVRQVLGGRLGRLVAIVDPAVPCSWQAMRLAETAEILR